MNECFSNWFYFKKYNFSFAKLVDFFQRGT